MRVGGIAQSMQCEHIDPSGCTAQLTGLRFRKPGVENEPKPEPSTNCSYISFICGIRNRVRVQERRPARCIRRLQCSRNTVKAISMVFTIAPLFDSASSVFKLFHVFLRPR